MHTINQTTKFRVVALGAATLLLAACGQQEAPQSSAVEEATAPAAAPASDKMPVTTSSEQAMALFMEGRKLADNLQVKEANDLFRQAVEADPDFAMGHMMVAQTAQTASEFFDALGKAQALAANVSDGERLVIEAASAGAENDQAAQLAALKNLVSTYPKDERTHTRLGTYFFGLQNFEEAAKHFGHSTQINPQFAPAYSMLGYANRQLEDFDAAKGAFEQYIELIPDSPNPYDSYAELLLESGDYEASIENYRKALEKDASFAASYAGLSINYSLMGDAVSAIEEAEHMLTAARNFNERQGAMFQAVQANLFAGELEAAEAMCQTMLAEAEVRGNHNAMGGVHEFMGDMMLDAGDGAAAEEHYAKALEHRMKADINEANKEQARRAHMFKTAAAAIIADDKEVAESRAAEYVTAAEANGTAFEKRRVHELKGWIAWMNEDLEGAVSHLAQANQNNPVVLYWSAVAHKELGNMDKASELANRAANRNTLSALLPFVRNEALALLAELEAA